MLETAVLHLIHFQDYLIKSNKEQHLFETEILFNYTHYCSEVWGNFVFYILLLSKDVSN